MKKLLLTLCLLAAHPFIGVTDTLERTIPTTSDFARQFLTNETSLQALQALGLSSNQAGIVVTGFQPADPALSNVVAGASNQYVGSFSGDFNINLANPTFTGRVTYNVQSAEAIAESYCRKAGILSVNARQDVHTFIAGIASLGLLTNLADFAFFEDGRNTPVGNPVSWRNTGQIIGTVNRIRGGLELPNYSQTNYFYFTNLPPTPNGRTLMWWGAGSPTAGARFADNAEQMMELTGPGGFIQGTVLAMYSGGSAFVPYSWNGTSQRIGVTPFYGASGTGLSQNTFNGWSLFCNALSCWGGGQDIVLKSDYPPSLFQYTNNDAFVTQPTVVRFGVKSDFAQQGWWGVVRAFAYFDCHLNSNQVVQVDALLPRVGVVVVGDSKSVSPAWWPYWTCSHNTWGLYSMLTNSAVAGTRMSEYYNQVQWGVTNSSIEYRWTNSDMVNWHTNATHPLIVASLRGGHNDFFNTNSATQAGMDEAYKALTNCAAMGRSNGWTVLVWNCDLTSVTSSGGSPGNSNLLMQFNGRIQRDSSNWDYFGDVYHYFYDQYGNAPWTNGSLYDAGGVHELGAGPALGTNGVAMWANTTLGYDFTPQKISPTILNTIVNNALFNDDSATSNIAYGSSTHPYKFSVQGDAGPQNRVGFSQAQAGYMGLYFGGVTPYSTNYTVQSQGTDLWLNAPDTAGDLWFANTHNAKARMRTSGGWDFSFSSYGLDPGAGAVSANVFDINGKVAIDNLVAHWGSKFTATNTITATGGFVHGTRASSVDTSITPTDEYLFLSGNHAATLPGATTNTGHSFTIKCSSSGTNAILTVSSQNIDAATSYTNTAQYKFVRVVSDGAGWQIVGQN